MAGRRSKLDKVQKQLIAALKTGATIADVCAHVGIAQSTYYAWLERGATEPDSAFSEFLEAATRAQLDAKVTAIGTLKSAMLPYREKSRRVETFTETRLDKHGEPYEYKKETVTETVSIYNGDWHAAIEFLKRRHPDEWGDKLDIDWRKELADAGLNPDEQLDSLTQQFVSALQRGAERPDAGSAESGESAGRGPAASG